MIKTKLIIFDLDGTLLNTIGVITKALNKALVDFGFETYEEEDVKSKVGYGTRRLIEDSVPNIDAELREKIYKNNRKYSDELTYDSEMFEDIDKLLDGLEAKGIKLAINTNKSHHRAVIISEKIFSKWIFCDVIGYTEGDVGKPDPENALKIMENAGVTREETIYVGDMIVDYETAKNAGMRIALCDWGFEKRDELKKLECDIYLKKPEDLLKYV